MDTQELTTSKEKRYATVRHPTIEATVKTRFRFNKPEQAQGRLAAIRENFVLSKKLMDEMFKGNPKSTDVIVWVRGFNVTKEEEENGFLGNYARIRVHDMKDGRWTLKAEKIPADLSNHPQKKRPPAKHPNWGHPILRSVTKSKIYETVDEASAALEMLHEEFPEISIPGGDKLYIMTYSRGKETVGTPVQKYILTIKLVPEGNGHCIIEAKENQKSARKTKPSYTGGKNAATVKEEVPKEKAAGFYTSMVELKRKRKNKTPIRPKKPKEAE